jgi:hypothetical protein
MAQDKYHYLSDIYERLQKIIRIQRGDLGPKNLLTNAEILSYKEKEVHSLDTLFLSLCLYWTDKKRAQKSLPTILEPLLKDAQNAGYDWLAMEAGELLTRLKPNHKYDMKAKALLQDQGIQTLADLIQPQEEWELSLKALIELQPQKTKSRAGATEKRLAWFITLNNSSWTIYPKEQSLNKKGEWTKGRPVALKRLKHNHGLCHHK